MEAGRAEQYYHLAAEMLLPLISPDSARPALWVLVTIYHRLLQRIENAHYDVFARASERSHGRELWILTARFVDGVSATAATKNLIN